MRESVIEDILREREKGERKDYKQDRHAGHAGSGPYRSLATGCMTLSIFRRCARQRGMRRGEADVRLRQCGRGLEADNEASQG